MKIENQEGLLLNVIADIGVLEWRKYQQRFPEVKVGNEMRREDHSGLPPFIAFRFKFISEDAIDKLRATVEGYKGALSWSFVGRSREGLPGINWMIAPSRLWEVEECAFKSNISAAVYLSIHELLLGPLAYKDLAGLTEHIRSEFSIF
jgi:hypothetical protein